MAQMLAMAKLQASKNLKGHCWQRQLYLQGRGIRPVHVAGRMVYCAMCMAP